MQTYYQIQNCAYYHSFIGYVITSLEEAIDIAVNDYEEFYQYEYIGDHLGYETHESYVSTAAPLDKEIIEQFEENEDIEIVTLSEEQLFNLQHNEVLYFIEGLEGSFEDLCEELNIPFDFEEIKRKFIEAV